METPINAVKARIEALNLLPSEALVNEVLNAAVAKVSDGSIKVAWRKLDAARKEAAKAAKQAAAPEAAPAAAVA